jgi:hypothetical protein
MEIVSRESDVNDVQAAAFDAVMLQAHVHAMSLCCPSPFQLAKILISYMESDVIHGDNVKV